MTGEWPDLAHSYDRVAEDYAATFADELAHKPFDRALLDAFAVAVTGPVLDVGCGPAGHITRYLADRGVDVSDMRALPVADACLGGLVAFYSVIHLPRPEIPVALREFHRVLTPGGALLIAMHGGTGEVGADNWFERDVSVRATLVEPPELAGLLEAAGFSIIERHQRDPYPAEYPSQRLYVLASR